LRIDTSSPEETRELGRLIGSLLDTGAFIGLTGDLGSGKTVLVQGLALGLGSDDPVSSPTFVIVNEYAGKLPIQHVDLYRLNDAASVESLGHRELFWSDGVTLVEWVERAGELVPDDRLDVTFSFVSEDRRSLTLEATGPRSEALLERVAGERGG